jgi:hypothetical protein
MAKGLIIRSEAFPLAMSLSPFAGLANKKTDIGERCRVAITGLDEQEWADDTPIAKQGQAN